MTKAEAVLEKIALSSELLERAATKAKLFGRTGQTKVFHKGFTKALDREIKDLLGPDFVLEKGLNRVRSKNIYGPSGVQEWNSRGGTFINLK
jgi:hypothetical protein